MTARLPALVTLTLATCLAAAARAETPQCNQALAKMRGEAANQANELEIAVRDNAPTERKCRLSAAYLATDAKVLAFMKNNQRRCNIEGLLVAQQQAVHDSNSKAKDVLCMPPHP